MPSKIYCHKCGSPNSYTSEKPRFCQKCGSSLSVATTKASPSKDLKTKPSLDAQGVSEEESFKIPDISSLAFDSQVFQNKSTTLSSLIEESKGQSSPPLDINSAVPRPSQTYGGENASAEEVAEAFRREAGAIKPNG